MSEILPPVGLRAVSETESMFFLPLPLPFCVLPSPAKEEEKSCLFSCLCFAAIDRERRRNRNFFKGLHVYEGKRGKKPCLMRIEPSKRL